MSEEISSYVEEIISVLQDEGVSREIIEKELKKFIDYGVPPEQAKRTLIKKFGSKKTVRKHLKDVEPDEKNLSLICKIITKNMKEITSGGKTKSIYYGLLGDETGVLPFTSWKADFPAEKGDVVEIRNAYSKEWQGTIQINIGERTSIRKLKDDEFHDIYQEPQRCKIKDLYASFGPVEIKVKIVSISEREVEIDGTKKKVFSGILGDETGKAQFTSWYDFNLNEGDVVKIEGCYTKFWKGIPQIIIDERSKVEKVSDDIEVGYISVPLYKLVEMKGGIDVATEGTVIEIRDGSGYVERCPDCNRLLIKNGECMIHGKVKGVADLRLKMIVDDGFAGLNVITNRAITEKLLEMDLEKCKKIVKSEGEEKLMEIIKDRLIGERVAVRGNAFGDEFGTTLVAKDVDIVDVDVKTEAQKLLEMLEGER